MRPKGAFRAAASFTLAALLLHCRPAVREPAADLPPPPPPTRGYILISLDTLRADRLGAYGYERPTSPFFDSLAARGTLFENAIVQFPGTLTSHMSMLTGLFPAEHGVYAPDGFLAPEVETVAEVFTEHGFRTAAFTEGGYMRGRFGFRQGFETYEARDRRGNRAVERTFERGLRFLRGLGEAEPFFLLLHTYAVHAPYRPPEPHRGRFWPGPPADTFEPTGPALRRHNLEGRDLSPEAREYFSSLYDETVRYLDGALAELFAGLDDLGLLDETTIVITSDHGEEFEEHGKVNHTQLYHEVLHVPLLFLHPELDDGRRYAPLVQTVDLAPTLYQLARFEEAPDTSGESFAPFLDRDTPPRESEAYAERTVRERALYVQTDDRLLHLVVSHRPEGAWYTRRVEIDVDEPEPELEARTWGEPRPLRITRVDDGDREELATVPLTEAWSSFLVQARLDGGKATLELSTPSCTPFTGPDGRVRQCRGFQLRGAPAVRVELFDVTRDPDERDDLSDDEPETVRRLVRRLAEYRFEAAAERRRQLDADTEEALRALGYL